MPEAGFFKKLLPPSITGDGKIQALAEAFERELKKIYELVETPAILSRIDELPEEVLDLLAWQFHVEGWELASSVEEKRNLIKRAIELHRYKGTKWAIKKVLEALHLSGEIKEWYEYGGKPYYFKVDLGVQDKEITTELRDKLINLINEYKNARSHLEEIVLGYQVLGSINFAIGQLAEAESYAEYVTDFEQVAEAVIPFAISSIAEAESVAVMEV